MKKTLQRYFTALKENTDDIRKKSLIAFGTTVATIVAGVVLTKLNEDRVDVVVLQPNEFEVHPAPSTSTTEF